MNIKNVLELHKKWLNNEKDGVRADLSGANLSGADLSWANLNGVTGLLSQVEYVKSHFKTNEKGIIAYKTFNEVHQANNNWVIEPGQYITENVNPNRTNRCGCGVNVGTPVFVLTNTRGKFGSA